MMLRVVVCLLLSATAANASATAHRELVVNSRYQYSYRLYYTPSSTHPNSSTAVQTVDTQVFLSLQALTQNTNVTVSSVGNTTSQPCQSNDKPQFNQCLDAVTFIDAVLDDSMDPEVVERGVLNSVRLFLSNMFNNQNQDLQTLFVAPIYRSTSIRLILVGLTEIMQDKEANLFVNVFFTRMQEALKPSFTLQQAKLLVQDVLGTNATQQATRRKLDMMVGRNTADSSAGTNMTPQVFTSVAMQAVCSSTDCTSDNLKQAVMVQSAELASSLVLALQAQGSTELQSPYFDQLQEIRVENGTSPNDLPPVPDTYIPTAETGEVPLWLWIVLGVDGLILVLAIVWVIFKVRQRRRENRDQKMVVGKDAYDGQPAVVVETIQDEPDAPLFPDDQPDIRLGDDLSRISFDETTTDLRRTASQAS